MNRIKNYIAFFLIFVGSNLYAQKFALIDMEYVMKNIPSYETANEQLTLLSKKWQSEVELLYKEAETMSRNYQTELVFLSDDMKAKREEEILAKEKWEKYIYFIQSWAKAHANPDFAGNSPPSFEEFCENDHREEEF